MAEVYDAPTVEARLREAALTLAALQVSMTRPSAFRSNMPEVVRVFDESYGWDGAPCRPSRPSPSDISLMDEALGWLQLIPDDKRVLRRIVAARSYTHPQTGRPLFSWRRIAAIVGANHVAVGRWHDQGIAFIVRALARPGLCLKSGGMLGLDRAVIEAARRRGRSRSGRCEPVS